MYYIIKKNQKKLMAVFAVLLMISFAATYSVGRGGGGGGRSDAVVAHMGATPIYDSQLRSAREEWDWLRQNGVRDPMQRRIPVAVDAILYTFIPRPPDPSSGGDQERYYQWLSRYLFARPGDPGGGEYRQAMAIAGGAYQAIDEHPELFYLLSEEAQRDGVQVNADGDEVNEYLFNVLGVQPDKIPSGSLARLSLQRLLLITGELRRLMNAVKVSEPAWQHDAAQAQSVRLSLIDFRADDFQKSVAAPTTQQAQQQFDRFKDVPSHATSPTNPLGFGYQIPARVKLQYVEIPHSEVLQAVIHTIHPGAIADSGAASGDPAYDWTVQAASYYEAHSDEFKNPPSTQPAARAAQIQTVTTQPTTVETASTEPTTKPFEEVKQQIVEKLATAQTEKLAKQIADELATRLNSDYQLIRQADPSAVIPATQPATQPAVFSSAATTQPTAQLMMLGHLEQIRDQLQQKYHVAIQLHDIENPWQTQADLAKLPGIGTANTADGTGSFADEATSFARSNLSTKEPALQVWQPSATLSDAQQNTYLFRLTAAEPPHAPPDMAPIAAQVQSDWKLSQAYDQAMQAAEKAFTSAKSVGLAQAARTAAQPVITTPLFPPRQVQDIPGYPLANPEAEQAVAKAAADLLAQATPTDKQPDSLVPLPSALRVAVIELAGVQLPEPEWRIQLDVTRSEQLAAVERIARDWFNYDPVVSRTGYKPEPKSE
jgi:hypothetical protein